MKYFYNILIIIVFYRELKFSAATSIAKWSLAENLQSMQIFTWSHVHVCSGYFTIGGYGEESMRHKSISLTNALPEQVLIQCASLQNSGLTKPLVF